MDTRPIGVFDSGLGGLTAVRELRRQMPSEHIIYFGDTSRVPYGNRSRETLLKYARQDLRFLASFQPKAVVIACGTVSSNCIETLQAENQIPIIGVVEPGARAACEASLSGDIAVIATESTIRSGAYAEAILRRRPDAQVRSLACPLFVPLAEEGWFDGPIVEGVAARYLEPLFRKAPAPDCLVLGCTHYPMLASAIRKVVGGGATIVDSAATTAQVVKRRLEERGLSHPEPGRSGDMLFFITDDPQRFTRTGSLFLNTHITDGDVRLVDLENVPLPPAETSASKPKNA